MAKLRNPVTGRVRNPAVPIRKVYSVKLCEARYAYFDDVVATTGAEAIAICRSGQIPWEDTVLRDFYKVEREYEAD